MTPRPGRLLHPAREVARRILSGAAERVRQAAARVSVVSLGVRGLVFAAGLAALLLASPVTLTGWPVAAALALLPAARPAGWIPSVVMFTAVGLWIVATTYFAEPVVFWRVLALAAALYLLHAAAALAAAIPLDAVIPGGVLLRWPLAVIPVLAATVGLAAVVVATLAHLPECRHRAALACGAGAMVVVVVVLTGMSGVTRRRR